MPRSMTGYGSAQVAGSRVAVEVEIKSVNARAFKFHCRTPGLLSQREPDLEKLVRERIRRGTVSLFVRLEFLRPQDVIRVKPEVVAGVAKALEDLRKKGFLTGELTADGVAAIPGALETGAEDPLRPADWKLVRDAVREAVAALDAMREREAAHLLKNLKSIVKALRGAVGRVRKRVPKVVDEARARLKERVDALLADHGTTLDDATLAREVALLADRSDVTEELTRLDAHCEEFLGYLARDGEVGRTLDFLTQEMLREANTIGSKSADVVLAKEVIELKSNVDRLKEQVANLE